MKLKLRPDDKKKASFDVVVGASPASGYKIVTRRGYNISLKPGREGIRAKLDEVLDDVQCVCNDNR